MSGRSGLWADWVLGFWVYIRCCGNGLLWFRPYGGSLLTNASKVTKKSCPGVRHFAEAQCSLATVSIRGHRLRFASLHLLSMYAASPHGAARLPPGWTPSLGLPKGLKIKSHIKSHIKSQSQSQSQSRSRDHSLRQFLQEIGCIQLKIWSAVRPPRWQASSHNLIRAHPMRQSRPTQHNER